jgi:hypothetical protein
MDDIIKSFEFESENIKLILNIRKEFHRNCLRVIIDGDVISNNKDIVRIDSSNGSSKDISLKYLNNTIFWISSNEWKGLRWEKYSNETKYLIFRNVSEMKEAYVIQREFISVIGDYFYDCIKNYKKVKLLYETQINEIVTEEELQ